MARNAQKGEVNKSAAIREVLKQNPKIQATEVVTLLAGKGITVAPGLVYFTKGKLRGKRGRRRGQKMQQEVAKVTPPTSNASVLATIKKVKMVASEVGGLRKLLALVEALSE